MFNTSEYSANKSCDDLVAALMTLCPAKETRTGNQLQAYKANMQQLRASIRTFARQGTVPLDSFATKKRCPVLGIIQPGISDMNDNIYLADPNTLFDTSKICRVLGRSRE